VTLAAAKPARFVRPRSPTCCSSAPRSYLFSAGLREQLCYPWILAFQLISHLRSVLEGGLPARPGAGAIPISTSTRNWQRNPLVGEAGRRAWLSPAVAQFHRASWCSDEAQAHWMSPPKSTSTLGVTEAGDRLCKCGSPPHTRLPSTNRSRSSMATVAGGRFPAPTMTSPTPKHDAPRVQGSNDQPQQRPTPRVPRPRGAGLAECLRRAVNGRFAMLGLRLQCC